MIYKKIWQFKSGAIHFNAQYDYIGCGWNTYNCDTVIILQFQFFILNISFFIYK